MKYWPVILALGLLAGCARFQSQPLSSADTAAGLESRSLDNPTLKAFLEKNLGRELNTWPATKWDFEMLTLAAFYYQPSLDVARAAWAESRAGIITAGARPNPTVGFTPQYVFNPGPEPAWVHTLNFDWPIETAGKRGSRIEQAKHLSESARLGIAATAWQVRSQLRLSVIDFTSATRRESLLRKQLAVQEQVVASLEQRRQAGAMASAEITPARLLLQKVRLDLGDAQRQQAEARAHVAEAIGVSLSALKDVEIAYDLAAFPADMDRLTFAAQIVFTLCGFELIYLIWGFLSHRFTVADAQATASVLAFLCFGLGGWAAQTVVSRGYYALGDTWLPTLVGTAVAFGAIPIYILLRHAWGVIGLASASGVAILIYVFLLGWLQYRRFAREAAKRGATLDRVPGMLDATVRLSLAAAVSIVAGLAIRGFVLEYLPGTDLAPLLARTALLSFVGIGIFAGLAALLGVRELSELKAFLARELREHVSQH